MHHTARLLLVLAVVSFATGLAAQDITITDDPAGYAWEGCVPVTPPWTLYILAHPGALGGLAGAEFYVDGLPAGWIAISAPNPAYITALGDPFATSSPYRCDIAFPSCMTPDANGVVTLYTVTVFATTAIVDHNLTVVAANPPTNINFTTPILFGCDVDFTPHPVSGGYFLMNPDYLSCTLAVESTHWGAVKQLFR